MHTWHTLCAARHHFDALQLLQICRLHWCPAQSTRWAFAFDPLPHFAKPFCSLLYLCVCGCACMFLSMMCISLTHTLFLSLSFFLSLYTLTHIYTRICTLVRTCLPTYIHTCMHTYVHTCMHAHTYIFICTHCWDNAYSEYIQVHFALAKSFKSCLEVFLVIVSRSIVIVGARCRVGTRDTHGLIIDAKH